MTTVITLWILSLAGLLAEGVTGSEYGVFGPWANLGALACVVSLLVFLVCKHLPKLSKDHAKEIAAARTEYSDVMDRMADRFERREAKRDEALEHLTAKIYELNVTCTKHQAVAYAKIAADELAETAKVAAERLKNTAKTVADELRENGTRKT